MAKRKINVVEERREAPETGIRIFEITRDGYAVRRDGYPAWFVDPSVPVLFETFANDRSRTWFLDRHLERINAALTVLGRRCRIDVPATVELLSTLFARFNDQYYRCRLFYHTGRSALFLTLRDEGPVVVPTAGITCMVSDIVSPYEWGVAMAIKSLNHYLPFALAREQAVRNNCSEVVLRDGRGYYLEGSHTSIFFIRDNTLLYPNQNMLAGVTRSVIVSIARCLGIPLRPALISETIALSSQAMLMTGSLTGIAPVRRLNGVRIYCPDHPLINIIREAYADETAHSL